MRLGYHRKWCLQPRGCREHIGIWLHLGSCRRLWYQTWLLIDEICRVLWLFMRKTSVERIELEDCGLCCVGKKRGLFRPRCGLIYLLVVGLIVVIADGITWSTSKNVRVQRAKTAVKIPKDRWVKIDLDEYDGIEGWFVIVIWIVSRNFKAMTSVSGFLTCQNWWKRQARASGGVWLTQQTVF